jgi:hypothetical protein
MNPDPHMLDDNWPMTYRDGQVVAGQQEGEGWNVTHHVVGFMNVYHQGEVAHETLVEAVHREIRTFTAAGLGLELAQLTQHPLDIGLANKLNYTFPGQGLKLGGQPDNPAFVATEVVPTMVVWHYPDATLDTLMAVLRLNIQFPLWARMPK